MRTLPQQLHSLPGRSGTCVVPNTASAVSTTGENCVPHSTVHRHIDTAQAPSSGNGIRWGPALNHRHSVNSQSLPPTSWVCDGSIDTDQVALRVQQHTA